MRTHAAGSISIIYISLECMHCWHRQSKSSQQSRGEKSKAMVLHTLRPSKRQPSSHHRNMQAAIMARRLTLDVPGALVPDEQRADGVLIDLGLGQELRGGPVVLVQEGPRPGVLPGVLGPLVLAFNAEEWVLGDLQAGAEVATSAGFVPRSGLTMPCA